MYAINHLPRYVRIASLILLVALAPFSLTHPAAEESIRFEGREYAAPDDFRYRAGIPEGTQLSELSTEASEISRSITASLVASLDGSFSRLYVSWYLREVKIDGKRQTFLRNRVETGFVDPPAGTRTAMRLFGGSDTRNFFAAVEKAVRGGF